MFYLPTAGQIMTMDQEGNVRFSEMPVIHPTPEKEAAKYRAEKLDATMNVIWNGLEVCLQILSGIAVAVLAAAALAGFFLIALAGFDAVLNGNATVSVSVSKFERR